MTNNDFLPESYEVPKNEGRYLKLQKGENKFRILSRPIVGWEDWKDKKPIRFRMNAKPDKSIDPKIPIRHFWAFVVWDYAESKIKILEITQKTIQGAIQSLSRDQDWGSPFEYDIKVIKTGENMETEYTVNPVPHKKIAAEIQEALIQTPVNLEALYDGGDPFEAKQVVKEIDDLPF